MNNESAPDKSSHRIYIYTPNDSIVVVTKSGKKGIVNLQGDEMVPPRYNEIVPLRQRMMFILP